MRQTEPSPAPWSVEIKDYTAYIRDGNGRLITSIGIYINADEANARLMATAPSLLTACEDALTVLQGEVAADCHWCEGEGGWTTDQPPRMTPVAHKPDCPVIKLEAVITKAKEG